MRVPLPKLEPGAVHASLTAGCSLTARPVGGESEAVWYVPLALELDAKAASVARAPTPAAQRQATSRAITRTGPRRVLIREARTRCPFEGGMLSYRRLSAPRREGYSSSEG